MDVKKHKLTALALALGDLTGKGDVNVSPSEMPAIIREQERQTQRKEQQTAVLQQQQENLRLKLNHKENLQKQQQTATRQLQLDKTAADAALKKELQSDKHQHQLKLAEIHASTKSAAKNSPTTKETQKTHAPLALTPFHITDTDGKQVHGYWSISPDTASQLIQTAIDLGDAAQMDYIRKLTGANPNADRRSVSAKALVLQNRMVSGQMGARSRMMALLSAIIPSLRGKGLIDGLLEASYVKR